MLTIFFTRETFHLEISPLNNVFPLNTFVKDVMLDTSQSAIGPCTPEEQSEEHVPTASWSATFVAGLNAAVQDGHGSGFNPLKKEATGRKKAALI